MIYLNKGILACTTSVGTAICPGVGTAVGFVVGGLACLAVDYFVGDWFDGLIDKIAV